MRLVKVLEVSEVSLRIAEKIPCGVCLGELPLSACSRRCSACNSTGFVKSITVLAEITVPSDSNVGDLCIP